MKHTTRSFTKYLFASMAVIAASVMVVCGANAAANVTLSWDANVPAPEGYRVFAREGSQSYNYEHPLKETSLTTCSLTGLVEGVTYHFVVRAYEGDLESVDSEEVSYTPAVVVPNQAPVADAGQNQVVSEGAPVVLNGSGSSDADGTIAGYRWTQTGGPGTVINNATHAQATFTAPVVGTNGDTLTFTLTVTDDDNSSAASSVTVSVIKSPGTDVDGDHVPDILDRFPNDPNEWADNDNDGTGDNQDPDDDNDGMTDAWENTHGLDPLTDDSALDGDGDGMSNAAEFHAGTDPMDDPANTAPAAPVMDSAVQTGRVDLTPVLVTGVYFDRDNDDHSLSRWQISTEADFSTLVLDETSQTELVAYTVGEMVLDADTVYYWRVKFVDARNGVSDWSRSSTFTTVTAAGSDDTDIDGVPDAQEVDGSVDVNENGIFDNLEDNIMSAHTVEGQTIVGVEVISENVSLVSIKSLPTDAIPDQSVKMGFGLVGFKLDLLNGVKTATVTIHFTKRVPGDARLYKYTADNGWGAYQNAVFAPNGKSVTMILEDGGVGDEDGIENGVIVDPSGIAYTDSMTSDSSSVSTGGASADGSGGGGCFISSGFREPGTLGPLSPNGAMAVIMLLVGWGVLFAAECRTHKKG